MFTRREDRTCQKVTFGMYVGRDIAAIFVVLTVVVMLLGFLGELIWAGTSARVTKVIPFLSFLNGNYWVSLYCLGGVFFFFILGVIGIGYMIYMASCGRSSSESQQEQENAPLAARGYNYR
jgi:hypothetical protein